MNIKTRLGEVTADIAIADKRWLRWLKCWKGMLGALWPGR
jgi:hypothetical protein